MKKIVLLLAASLVLSATAFAEEENGALGFGFVAEGSESGNASLRGSLFLDAGTQLYGPFHYGFELQGDVKRLDQSSESVSVTDVTTYVFGSSAVIYLNTTNYDITYTLWDLDLSPRAYLSFDVGNKIQLLGFAGLNYNWQTLDVSVENRSSHDKTTKSTNTGGEWTVVAGARVTVGAFYLDYTRFLESNTTGDVSWNTYNKDRLGLGINLRF